MIKVTKVLTESFCEFKEGNKKETGSLDRFKGHAAPFFLYDPSTETYTLSGPAPELTPAYITDLLKKTCSTWLVAELGRGAYDNMMASPSRVIPVTVTRLADIDQAYHPLVRRALFFLFGDLFKPVSFVCETVDEVMQVMKEHPYPMKQRLTILDRPGPEPEFGCHRTVVHEPGRMYNQHELVILDKGAGGAGGGGVRCKILIQTNFSISKE